MFFLFYCSQYKSHHRLHSLTSTFISLRWTFHTLKTLSLLLFPSHLLLFPFFPLFLPYSSIPPLSSTPLNLSPTPMITCMSYALVIALAFLITLVIMSPIVQPLNSFDHGPTSFTQADKVLNK